MPRDFPNFPMTFAPVPRFDRHRACSAVAAPVEQAGGQRA
jgi:hypothetical protein